MPALTDGFITFIDGASIQRWQYASQGALNGQSIVAPWQAIIDPDTGNYFGSSNPFTIVALALAPQSSQELEAAHIFNATTGTPGPCVIAGMQVNAIGQGGWLLLYDAVAPPADGAVVPLKAWQLAPNTTFNYAGPPLKMSAGCTLVFSSTGPFNQTSANAATFSAEIH